MVRSRSAVVLLPLLAWGCGDQSHSSAELHTAAPTAVTIVGSLQSELGCAEDWQPACAATHLTYDGEDDVWQASFDLPAGAFEYKVALNDSWDENYGANAAPNGANILLEVAAPATVKLYYSHSTHWVADSHNTVIATAPGSFQSELGCSGDWDPSCLRSWLQDPDGDGLHTFTTNVIPPGNYEVKVTIDEGWDENYGMDGAPNGPNIPFSVGASGAELTFTYDATSHILTITGGLPPEPTAVDIDILPNSDRNTINLNRRSVPVAILGSFLFDVINIDVGSIRFGPGAAVELHDLSDPAILAEHTRDVNADGFSDLLLHFGVADSGITISTTEACVSFQSWAVVSFLGCDSVAIRTR